MSKTSIDTAWYEGFRGRADWITPGSWRGRVEGIDEEVTFLAEGVILFGQIQDAFERAVDGYLARCREAGKQPSRTPAGSVVVPRLTESDFEDAYLRLTGFRVLPGRARKVLGTIDQWSFGVTAFGTCDVAWAPDGSVTIKKG